MDTPPVSYHLIYRPGDATQGTSDQIVELLATDSPSDVLLVTGANPGSVAMQLEASDLDEVHQELSLLGFTSHHRMRSPV